MLGKITTRHTISSVPSVTSKRFTSAKKNRTITKQILFYKGRLVLSDEANKNTGKKSPSLEYFCKHNKNR